MRTYAYDPLARDINVAAFGPLSERTCTRCHQRRTCLLHALSWTLNSDAQCTAVRLVPQGLSRVTMRKSTPGNDMCVVTYREISHGARVVCCRSHAKALSKTPHAPRARCVVFFYVFTTLVPPTGCEQAASPMRPSDARHTHPQARPAASWQPSQQFARALVVAVFRWRSAQ